MERKINTDATGNREYGVGFTGASEQARACVRAHTCAGGVFFVGGCSADCKLHCGGGKRVRGVGLSLLSFSSLTWNFDPFNIPVGASTWKTHKKPKFPNANPPSYSVSPCNFYACMADSIKAYSRNCNGNTVFAFTSCVASRLRWLDAL